MEEQLITFETAKLAKEKGLTYSDVGCSFRPNGEFTYGRNDESFFPAPTQSLLHKWLREKHFLYCVIIPTITGDWAFKVIDIQCNPEHPIERPPYNNVNAFDYPIYEKALEDALQEALKLLNNNLK
jgi:hypothetical protein